MGRVRVLKHGYDPPYSLFEGKERFLGTFEFKEFCGERIQMWRDERELI